MSDRELKLTALTPEQLAMVLTRSGKRKITAQDVEDIARAGGIFSEQERISLVEFTAFLAKEVAGGAD